MTCTVLGPGLVGAYLGAAGGATSAVSRSTVARSWLVDLPAGTLAWSPRLTRDIPDLGPLLVATRCHQTPWQSLRGEVLIAQNGLGQPQPIAVCFMAIDRDAHGHLVATGMSPRLVIGSLPASWNQVVANWRRAGIVVDEVADVRPAQWEKTILNATVGPLCLATGSTMSAIWADAHLRRLVLQATREGAALAAAMGCPTRPGFVDWAAQFFSQVGDHLPSVVRDPGELPWTLGYLVKHAARNRVAIPALTDIAQRLPSSCPLMDSAAMRLAS